MPKRALFLLRPQQSWTTLITEPPRCRFLILHCTTEPAHARVDAGECLVITSLLTQVLYVDIVDEYVTIIFQITETSNRT